MSRPERKRRWDREHMTRTGNPGGNGHYVKARERELMRRLRREGWKVEEIAARVNRHYATVRKHTKDVIL